MNKLVALQERCKFGVYVDINSHRIFCGNENGARKALEHVKFDGVEIADDIRKAMIERDEIVTVQCYPNTSSSSVMFAHYDVEQAISQAYDEMFG